MNTWNKALKSRLEVACILSYVAAALCLFAMAWTGGGLGAAGALLFFVGGCLCEAPRRLLEIAEIVEERLNRRIIPMLEYIEYEARSVENIF